MVTSTKSAGDSNASDSASQTGISACPNRAGAALSDTTTASPCAVLVDICSAKANRISCLAKAARAMLMTCEVWDDADEELFAVCECFDAIIENALEIHSAGYEAYAATKEEAHG